MQNFAFPYFSRDIAEFWRRWHISLSSWFRDYLYIPLGGSRGGTWMKFRNTFSIFIVSGFWHGANWTFIAWGALNAVYFLPILLTKNNRRNLDTVAEGKYLPSFKEFSSIALTFGLTVIAWIFFRADNITHAKNYLLTIFSRTIFAPIDNIPFGLFFIMLFFISIEWLNREKQFGLARFEKDNWVFTIIDKTIILVTFWMIVIWNSSKEVEFIYFQF